MIGWTSGAIEGSHTERWSKREVEAGFVFSQYAAETLSKGEINELRGNPTIEMKKSKSVRQLRE